jgi:hypothetical protein
MSGAWPAERIRAAAETLLAELASVPRAAGSEEERGARERCARWLSEQGFDVIEEPFEYSAFPGRWATSAAGVLAMLLMLGAGAAGNSGRPAVALTLLLGGGSLLAAGGWWLSRYGVLQLPLARARSANLVATRGEPAVWMVAHLDSKSQPVPILMRAAGIVLVSIVWLIALALAAAQASGARTGWVDVWWWLGAGGALAACAVAASVVGNGSDGAVDNASGVTTVLVAAAMLPATAKVGVLITSAEELGLAGARAWVAGTGVTERAKVPVLNVDGVDDGGTVTVMHGARPPGRIREALVSAARAQRVRVRGRRLLPGILADSVAFSDAGWDAVTVSRGSIATLARIHRPADRPSDMSGSGIAIVAPLVASAAASLASREVAA